MRHRNGRSIFGVSFADIASGERSRCNVMPVEGTLHGVPKAVHLVASGPQHGSPLSPDSLDEETRRAYEAWLRARIEEAHV